MIIKLLNSLFAPISSRIAVKLIGGVLFLVVLVSLISNWITISDEKQILYEQIDAQGKAISATAASSAVEPLLIRDYPVLETFSKLLIEEHQGISFVRIERSDGQAVVEIPPGVYKKSSVHKICRIYTSRILADRESDKAIGKVIIGLSTRQVKAVVSSHIRTLFRSMILSSLLIILLLLILLRKIVVVPIKRLEQAVSRIEPDDLTTPLSLPGNDEISRLGDTFNQMRCRLESSMLENIKIRKLLSNIINSMPSVLVGVNTDGIITQWNQKAERTTNMSPETAVGQPLAQAFPQLTDEIERVREAMQTQKICYDHRQVLNNDGETHYDEVTVYPLIDDGVEGAVIRVDDVTKRVRAEEERVRLSTAIEQAQEIIVITDADANIQYVNPAFENITGYTSSEIHGQNLRILQSSEHDKHYYTDMWHTLTGGNTWRGHLINKKKDGSIYHEEATISPVKDTSGSIVNYVAVKRDITKEMQKDKQLQQSQKMESIGTLAGGIAHDFNNILAAIMGYTQLSLDDVKDMPETHQSLKEVLIASNRAKDLVSQILMFSRSTEIEKKPVKTIPIVKEVCKFMRSSLPTTIEIRQHITAKNDWIMTDPTQFHQVLMNLITNAGHAMMERGGVLEVLLEETFINKNDLAAHSDLKIGVYLKISVKDTGYGISKDNLGRIFEPYFTTKEKGEGTGLGLAVVHGIIKEHGGDIRAYSEVGKGTAFHVLLPLLQKESEAFDSEVSAPLPTGTESIMFVDDEGALIETSKRQLERLGYRVTGASNAQQALELINEAKDNFDLIITDKTMPKMTGFDLAHEIRKICSEIPIILCTGFKEKGDDTKVSKAGINAIIMKPINNREIAEMIRKLLGQKES